jgi:hypothetical protein
MIDAFNLFLAALAVGSGVGLGVPLGFALYHYAGSRLGLILSARVKPESRP